MLCFRLDMAESGSAPLPDLPALSGTVPEHCTLARRGPAFLSCSLVMVVVVCALEYEEVRCPLVVLATLELL